MGDIEKLEAWKLMEQEINETPDSLKIFATEVLGISTSEDLANTRHFIRIFELSCKRISSKNSLYQRELALSQGKRKWRGRRWKHSTTLRRWGRSEIMDLRHQSSAMCIIILGGEDIHPWSATKVGNPLPDTITVDRWNFLLKLQWYRGLKISYM